MTTSELTTLLLATCPVYGVDSNGVITFDPAATPQQKQDAQSVVTTNLPKLNGQPQRVPLSYVTTYNALKALNATQQNQVLGAVISFILVNNPQLATAINTQFPGINLPFDQANPNG